MITKLSIPIFIGLLALAGCAADKPNVYYTLTLPQGDPSPSVAGKLPGLYRIASLTVPPQVDDMPIVVRQSDDQLMKLTHDRWTAPLAQQIQNALSIALTQQLGAPPIAGGQTVANQSALTTLYVEVQRFDLVPGRFASMDVIWQWQPPTRPKKGSVPVCFTRLKADVQPGVAPLVQGQQENIAKLAEIMAGAWQTGQVPPQTRCQS
jgi:uncharacterized protein